MFNEKEKEKKQQKNTPVQVEAHCLVENWTVKVAFVYNEAASWRRKLRLWVDDVVFCSHTPGKPSPHVLRNVVQFQ